MESKHNVWKAKLKGIGKKREIKAKLDGKESRTKAINEELEGGGGVRGKVGLMRGGGRGVHRRINEVYKEKGVARRRLVFEGGM
jgi:hypothetical protein